MTHKKCRPAEEAAVSVSLPSPVWEIDAAVEEGLIESMKTLTLPAAAISVRDPDPIPLGTGVTDQQQQETKELDGFTLAEYALPSPLSSPSLQPAAYTYNVCTVLADAVGPSPATRGPVHSRSDHFPCCRCYHLAAAVS